MKATLKFKLGHQDAKQLMANAGAAMGNKGQDYGRGALAKLAYRQQLKAQSVNPKTPAGWGPVTRMAVRRLSSGLRGKGF